MAASKGPSVWKYVRGLAPPVLLLAALLGWLGHSLYSRVRWWQEADEYNLREWLNESRVFRKTLPELVREYLDDPDEKKANEIREQLKALGNPTRMYQGQLPLFPDVYVLELKFTDPKHPKLEPLVWDSQVPRPKGVRKMDYPLLGRQDDRARLYVEYELHAYNKHQRDEQHQQALTMVAGALTGAAAIVVGLWVYFFLKRERQRELQRLLTHQQIERAERQALENELKRQEAERRHEETERTLLEQRLATQVAEQQALELKSQLYASIGIMAGSYAHNIKNLLVRPNDLLSRCLEAEGLSGDQEHMLTRGARDARHRDGALAADPAHGPPRSGPHRADAHRPERPDARHAADLGRPGPREVEADADARRRAGSRCGSRATCRICSRRSRTCCSTPATPPSRCATNFASRPRRAAGLDATGAGGRR